MDRNLLGGKWKCYVTGRWCTKLNLRKTFGRATGFSLRIEKYSFSHRYFFFFFLFFLLKFKIHICMYAFTGYLAIMHNLIPSEQSFIVRVSSAAVGIKVQYRTETVTMC